jgi:Tc5 transposase DNA-binding domain
MDKRSPITDAQLKERAIAAARRQGIPEHKFKASGGWVDNFKSRHRIKKGKVLPKQADMTAALDRLNTHISTRMSISSAASISDAASVVWTDDDVLEQYSPDKPYTAFSPEKATNIGSPERPFLASAMPSPARPLQTPSPQRRESGPGQMPHLVLSTPPQTISPQHLQQPQLLPPLPPQGQSTNASAPAFAPSAAPSHFFPNSFTMFSFNQPSATAMTTMTAMAVEAPQPQPQTGNVPGTILSPPEVHQSLSTIHQVVFGAASQVFTDEEKSMWESMEKRILNWLMEQQSITNSNASGPRPNHFSG